jgi:aspartyl-tRNA(Asn)/glutamyl-tRNA(Gln) amidotransferase subunit B
MPTKIAQELSLLATENDNNALKVWCTEAIDALPQEAQRVRDGNERVLNRILGYVIKMSRGRANPEVAKVMLLNMLRQ